MTDMITEARIERATLTVTNLIDPLQVEQVRTDVVFTVTIPDEFWDDEPTFMVKMWIPAMSTLCVGRPRVKVLGRADGDQSVIFAFPHLELDRIAATEFDMAGKPPISTVIWTAHKDRQGNVFAMRNLTTGEVLSTNG